MDASTRENARLIKGDVVVGMEQVGNTRYVKGKILINQPPAAVWPLLTNPFEFKEKICPRMKNVEIMVDQSTMSRMKVKLDGTIFIPNMYYVVDSHYVHEQRIDFHSVEGTFKEFKGFWTLKRWPDGQRTEVSYCLDVDPGFFLPHWLVQAGVRNELPKTLQGLRRRVQAVARAEEQPEMQSIAAASHHLSHPAPTSPL